MTARTHRIGMALAAFVLPGVLSTLALAAEPGGATSADAPIRIWLAAGKLHPLVVHFPIALLVVALVFEFARLRRGTYKPSAAGTICVVLGGIGAIAAATLGWSSAESAGYGGTTAWILTTHRWAGVATACLGVVASIAALAARMGNDPRLLNAYRLATLFAVIAVSVAGHFGGSLVHGETYIQDAIAQALGRDIATDAKVTLAASGAPADFSRDIEPILAKRCYQCHTGEKPDGGLNLATLAGALKGGKSGKPALIAGKSAESYLYLLITGADPKKRMPPKGGPLSDDQVVAIKSWIDGGAHWTSSHAAGEHWHWAYRAPVRANPPAVKDTLWPRSPIDHFILSKIEAEGLTHADEADRQTLVRRLWLDLAGLPPTPQEAALYVNDRSPGAYERAIDRVLASPHFGEKWARLWLDMARYADSHGYEKDSLRVMWPYRDWVINAFNADMPFDEFTIEQLAGDLLPDATGEQLVATGFHRNTQTNEEGGVDDEEFRVDAVIDRINTTGSVWLGSTVGCAQCHDHKNDPLKQKEYYQLLAIFNQDSLDVQKISSIERYAAGAMVDYPRSASFQQLHDLDNRIAEAQRQLAAETPSFTREQGEWEARTAAALESWHPLTPARAVSSASASLKPLPDGSVLVVAAEPSSSGAAPAPKDVYELDIVLPPGTTAIRLETLTDPSLPKGGGGLSNNSNFVLTDFSISTLTPDGAPAQRLAFSAAAADYEQNVNQTSYPIAAAIDQDPATGWAVAGQTDRAHTAIFTLAAPITQQTSARVTLRQEYGERHLIGRPRISATSQPPADVLAPLSVPYDALGALAAAPASRTPEQTHAIETYFRTIAPSLAPARTLLADLTAQRSSMVVAKALVMKANDTPRETHIFSRGSFLSPGDRVEPGTPSYLPPMPKGVKADRLAFARWLVSAENPLTARVTVNRLWEALFGKGIVETSEDFGPQGDAPTHPELLDWLATELIRNQWSLKQTLREIVLSSTYRQSSRVTPELLAKDPANRLYARAPRFRVDAETIRDIGLVASGLLTHTIGGPSVFPPQPDGTWTQIYSGYRWEESTGPDRYRRGLYTFWRRTSPYPAFVTFDAPSREIACTRRPRTNTPLQALTTLNDPAYVEMAAAMARRIMTEGGPTTESRAAYGMALCITRQPTPKEIARIVALHDQELQRYRLDESAARELGGVGAAGAGGEFDPSDTSAWTLVANVLLNLDETITRQ